jgi:SAM-dependent methyltransferase
MMTIEGRRNQDYSTIREYYDREYYRNCSIVEKTPGHYRRLASRFRPWSGKCLLDIGCGTGLWLRAATEFGAKPAGIDLSYMALDVCRRSLPAAELHCGPAERLPFDDRQFDFISCLGALEHFLEPRAALREMIRVAKPNASFLLLVPNAGFLIRRLGLYGGTQQVVVHEEALPLQVWQELFESVGLLIQKRWKDLHVLSVPWITQGPWYLVPARLAQALALLVWPLSWQYQVYYLCSLKKLRLSL